MEWGRIIPKHMSDHLLARRRIDVTRHTHGNSDGNLPEQLQIFAIGFIDSRYVAEPINDSQGDRILVALNETKAAK